MADHFANGYWDGDYWVESYFGSDVAGSMVAGLSGSGGVSATISVAGDNVVHLHGVKPRYVYRARGRNFDRKLELEAIALEAQAQVEIALRNETVAAEQLAEFVRIEVERAAEVLEGISALTQAMTESVTQSILAYQRAQTASADQFQIEEEDEIAFLLLCA
jgi:hypothetical protein